MTVSKRLRYALVLYLALLGQPRMSQADDGVLPLLSGQPAPRQGYFVDDEHMKEGLKQAAFLRTLIETHTLEVRSLREQTKLAVETEQERGKILLEAEREKAKIEIEAMRARNVALEEENYKLKNPPFYKTQWFSSATTALLITVVRFAF